MNYLAHIALSGNNTNVMIGNFIGDFIKGNDFNKYSNDLRKGMLLHRAIDYFTDNHPLTTKSKRRFYKDFPKMGGIITDILYDYFLCQHWNKFYTIDLDDFITITYKTLENNKNRFPKKMNPLYQHLITNNWFLRYQTQEGTALSLIQIGNRMKYGKNLSLAFEIVNENLDDFYSEFDIFYQELIDFSTDFLNNH